tara:strand:- start:238 stop:402 length:165 start_codon:yes stop_codon:yes gene_type:complete
MTTQQSEKERQLKVRVKRLKERAKQMAAVKEAPFMQVLERWLDEPKAKDTTDER